MIKNFTPVVLFYVWTSCFPLMAQVSPQWTDSEIMRANTGKDVTYLNDVEKEAILCLNLARLYPQKFIDLELKDFNGTPKYGDYLKKSDYKKSLIRELKNMEPLDPLIPNAEMTLNAKCFAEEMGASGYVGHERDKCPEGNYAECCSYGMTTGKEIILQLLIDDKVTSLGHRKICLKSTYLKIGIATSDHVKWGSCSVLEFI